MNHVYNRKHCFLFDNLFIKYIIQLYNIMLYIGIFVIFNDYSKIKFFLGIIILFV